ncbi:MAG: tat (twin-arginine translocation) pathway signal sequence [Gammaproteobacteria bacterium]
MRELLEDYRRPGRRTFLRASGVLTGLLWGSSHALLALAPGRAWALDLEVFDDRSARVLLTLTRHIFPHATLDDAVYAFVVEALDAASAQDTSVAALLQDGIRALDAVGDGDWLARRAQDQLAHVHAIAGNPFFEKVRSTAVVALYNNALAFAHFGYEGNAFNQGGGYLHRGFDDLRWLPAPPASASPPPA